MSISTCHTLQPSLELESRKQAIKSHISNNPRPHPNRTEFAGIHETCKFDNQTRLALRPRPCLLSIDTLRHSRRLACYRRHLFHAAITVVHYTLRPRTTAKLNADTRAALADLPPRLLASTPRPPILRVQFRGHASITMPLESTLSRAGPRWNDMR